MIITTDFQNAFISGENQSRASLNYTQDGQNKWLGIFYEAGTPEDRRALTTTTKELAFLVSNAAIIDPVYGNRKGRVQLDVPFDGQTYQNSKTMYLSPGMQAFADYTGPNKWFVCEEFFIGFPWAGDPHAARISIHLYPYQGNLFFAVGAQTQNPEDGGRWATSLWSAPIKGIPVPIGAKFELYTGYQMQYGDKGNFALWIRRPNEDWVNLVAIHDYMYNPLATTVPANTKANPCKLYTSGDVIDNGSCALAWDNLNIISY